MYACYHGTWQDMTLRLNTHACENSYALKRLTPFQVATMSLAFLRQLPTPWRAILLATGILIANALLGWIGAALSMHTLAFFLIGIIDGIGIAILAIYLISEKFQVLAVGVGTGSIAPSVAQTNLSSGFIQLSSSVTDLASKIVEGFTGPGLPPALAGALRLSVTVAIMVVFLSLVCNLVINWKEAPKRLEQRP